ncbi:hypothetical protein [Salmonirosea aquatica]|uniref:Uncharacterized protein n=1 Tax=Salmonirosea aquatica TaxID=2654236 RepID=A0A7C9F4Y8_9BACT|nr:hypothetical protein [Cytophagaceae bacterium SJW1-29]
MKLTVFMMASVLGLLILGCQKDSLAPVNDTAFEAMTLSAARYSVEADSTTKMKCKGRLMELAEAAIPAAVTAHISANYDGATLKFAATDESGNVVIGLTLADGTPKGLLFDSAGNFKEELKHYKQHAKLTEVAVVDLPASITDYVAATYAGAEIKHAGTNEAGEYFVMLVSDSKPVVLLFNADGTFNKALDKPMHHGKKFGPGRK